MAADMVKSRLEGSELMAVKGAGDRTTQAYRADVAAFLASGKPVTVEGFTAYVNTLRGKRSAATVNQVLAAGRKAFAQAAERLGLAARELAVIRGALAEIPRVKLAPPEVHVVTPEERERLFKALPIRVRLIAEVLYVTGARVTEVLTVHRDQVKVNGHAELRLMGKGAKERTALIPAALYRRILATFTEGEYLFTTERGNRFAGPYVSRELARASKRVLGREIRAHVLRHSRATDLLATTHRIKAVSRLLGHADESTTLRYYVRDAFTAEELFTGM